MVIQGSAHGKYITARVIQDWDTGSTLTLSFYNTNTREVHYRYGYTRFGYGKYINAIVVQGWDTESTLTLLLYKVVGCIGYSGAWHYIVVLGLACPLGRKVKFSTLLVTRSSLVILTFMRYTTGQLDPCGPRLMRLWLREGKP